MATQAPTRPDDDKTVRKQLLERREKLHMAAVAQEPSGYLAALMEEVDAALARLDEGSFGLCETCHEPIERQRLVSNPLLRFCLDHLTSIERRSLEQDLVMSELNPRCFQWTASHVQDGSLPITTSPPAW